MLGEDPTREECYPARERARAMLHEVTLDYKEPGSCVIKENTLKAKGNLAAFQVL